MSDVNARPDKANLPPIFTFQNAQAGNADGTELTIAGYFGLTVQLIGTFAGTVNFEGTVDGTNYKPLQGTNLDDASKATIATTTGIFMFATPGLQKVRMRTSGMTSGSVTIKGFPYAVLPTFTGDVELSATTVVVGTVKIQSGASTDLATVDATKNLYVNLRTAGNEAGTSANPIRIDPTGTTNQPIRPSTGTLTDGSGSITLGGTSQQIFAANANRKYLFIQNISTENMFINFTTVAVQDQPSIKLIPNASFIMEASFVSTETVNIISATTGSKFVAKQA